MYVRTIKLEEVMMEEVRVRKPKRTIPIEARKVSFLVSWSPEVIAWLRSNHDNVSGYVNEMVKKEMQREARKQKIHGGSNGTA